LTLEHAKISKRYPEWLVMTPMTCAAWKGERVGQATWDSLNELNNKIVFILHASTVAQTTKKYQNDMRKNYARWATEYNREVKLIFLDSK